MPRLGTAKPPTSRFYKPRGNSTVFSDLYKKAINEAWPTQAGRPPKLRPSSFPMCPILTWTRMVKGAHLGYWPEDQDFSGQYFTQVGTLVHEIIQLYIGETGKIWGNWKCKNDRCKYGKRKSLTRKHTVNNRCPGCGRPMQYEEIEVKYAGIVGHIDAIIYLGQGQYWIGDYKTTTKYKLTSGKLPEKSHLKQIPAYVYMAVKGLGLNVIGFSLLYLTRDNPHLFLEESFEWDSTWEKKAKLMLKGEKKRYKAALQDFKERKIHRIIQNKPCTSKKFYNEYLDYYTPCPYLGVCFKPEELWTTLQAVKQEHPYSRKTAHLIATDLDPANQ